MQPVVVKEVHGEKPWRFENGNLRVFRCVRAVLADAISFRQHHHEPSCRQHQMIPHYVYRPGKDATLCCACHYPSRKTDSKTHCNELPANRAHATSLPRWHRNMISLLPLAFRATCKLADIHHVFTLSAWPKAGQASSIGLSLVRPSIVGGPTSRQQCAY
jgi:hypothetical protein